MLLKPNECLHTVKFLSGLKSYIILELACDLATYWEKGQNPESPWLATDSGFLLNKYYWAEVNMGRNTSYSKGTGFRRTNTVKKLLLPHFRGAEAPLQWHSGPRTRLYNGDKLKNQARLLKVFPWRLSLFLRWKLTMHFLLLGVYYPSLPTFPSHRAMNSKK